MCTASRYNLSTSKPFPWPARSWIRGTEFWQWLNPTQNFCHIRFHAVPSLSMSNDFRRVPPIAFWENRASARTRVCPQILVSLFFYFVFLLTVALIARSYTRTCKRTLMCLFCTIYQHFLRLFSMRWNVIKRFTRVTSGVGGLSCHLLITSTPYVTTCVSLPSPPVHIWEMNGVGWATEKNI